MKKKAASYFKMYTSLKRIIRSGWRSFFRDGGSVAANLFILVMTISLITSLFFLREGSDFLISKIEEKADISVYFKEEALEEKIFEIRDEVSQIAEVEEVDYISKEMALEDFRKRHKDDPVLMESLAEVGKNPFLASLNIRAWQASQYEAVSQFFENSEVRDVIEKVDYYQRKPLIERVFSITSAMNQTGILFSLILAIVAILVTFNAIRLSIINLGEEISIQRLVGASNWFIRGPFIVQGIIAGFFATLICLSIFGFLSWFLNPRVLTLLPGLNLFNLFMTNFWTLFLIQLATGIGLGAVSSLIAIRRYLKV